MRISDWSSDVCSSDLSRGQPAAERGELSIIVGGAETTLQRCRWILDILGTDIVHCGGLGAGHVAKALNNIVNAANVIVGGEAVLIGVKAGLDPRTGVDVLCASSGGPEIGGASGRERVGRDGWIAGGAGDIKKK